MRIAFTVHKLPPESLGGTEIYTRTLARVLVEQGHDVAIFAPATTVEQAIEVRDADGVRRFLTPLPASRASENPAAQFWHTFRDRAIEKDFDRFLGDVRPEVVHFQHVQGVSVRLIEQAEGLPRVATLHDYWYFCANSQLIRPDRSVCAGPSPGCRNCVDCATARADLNILRTLRPITALPLAYRNHTLGDAVQHLDRMIAPSAFLREQYVQQGFDGSRIVVMENGLDTTRVDNSVRTGGRAPLADRPVRFGFLGTLAWQKGVHVLVEAFQNVPSSAATLDIYGSATAFPDYAAELRSANRNPAVRIHPPVAQDAVGRILGEFDVLIVPSLWYENSPLVIQEAYAAGVPVIASRLGALEEKVQEGVSGWHFAPGDAADLARVITGVLAEPEQITRLVATLPTPPTMEEQARELVALYRSLASVS